VGFRLAVAAGCLAALALTLGLVAAVVPPRAAPPTEAVAEGPDPSAGDPEPGDTAVPPAVPVREQPPLVPREDKAAERLLNSLLPPVGGLPEAAPRSVAARKKTHPTPYQFMHLDQSRESDLRAQLCLAPEIGLGGTGLRVYQSYVQTIALNLPVTVIVNQSDPAPLLQVLPDLRGLPLRAGPSCQLTGKQAATLDALSRKLRIYLSVAAPQDAQGHRSDPARLHEALRAEKRGKRPEWLRAEAVPTLMQMLMPEEAPVRRMLVELLTEIRHRAATEALARRAVFDLDAEVREAAVNALRERPADDYRPILLQAFRYPWAPAAEHAAEALAVLKDRDAVPHLVTLLKQPDPAAPRKLPNKYVVVQEVVRANHLNNCLMCHPPAVTGNDPVLGLDPVVSLPVRTRGAPPAGAVQRIQSTPGSHGYGGGGSATQTPVVIRGDVTFFRQDFSVQLPIPRAAPPRGQPGAPAAPTQRFDYVVRTRFLTREELVQYKKTQTDRPTSYPQREAVLFALRRLTGDDAGPTTEAWLERFPRAEEDVEAARLSRKLIQTASPRRDLLLIRLRDGKEPANTRALAVAIPSLKGEFQEKARAALAERLGRLAPRALRSHLRDDDPEVRQAALQVCYEKGDRAYVPDLIALLSDAEPVTARTAAAGLHSLTGQDLDSPAEWQAWWKKQGTK
jgi:HEAT repeat protein